MSAVDGRRTTKVYSQPNFYSHRIEWFSAVAVDVFAEGRYIGMQWQQFAGPFPTETEARMAQDG